MLRMRYAEALSEWQAAVRLSPSISDFHNFEGLALDNLGRHDEARAAYNTAIRLRPGNVEARSNLAYNLATAGRTREAQLEFNRALALRPSDASLRLGRGLLLFELGDAAAACRDFRQAPPWPADANTIWTIFRACLSAGNVENALTAARLLPRDPPVQLEIGSAMVRSHHLAESSVFLAAAAAAPDFRTQAAVVMADGYLASGDPARAIQILLDLPPDFAVLELRAGALLKLNRADQAQTVLNQLLRTYPENPSAYIASTQSLLEARRFDDALAILNSGLERLPGNWLLLLRRGITYKLRGSYPQAREDLTASLASEGDPSLVAAALGDVMAAEGDVSGAARIFQRVMQQTRQPQFQLAFALALSQMGDNAKALQECALAVQLLPGNARAHFEYGKLLRQSENPHAARREFERARRLDPRLGANLYALSRIYRELGDAPRAEAATREFLMTKRSSQ